MIINEKIIDRYWMAFPFLAVAFLVSQYINYYFDDTLIYLRYIKNFQNGHGLVYNIGEKFNGLTSPLYSYIVLLFSFVTPSKYLIEMNNILSGFFLLLTSIITSITFFDKNTNQKIVVSVIIAAFPYFYSVLGMESNFFIFLISLVFYYYKKEDELYFVVLAALIITRSEGAFLAIPFGLDYLLKHRKLPSIKILLVCFFICLIPYLINYFYYGSMIPNSANAKILQGQSRLWGENKITNFLSWDWREIFGFQLRYHLTTLVLACLGLVLYRNKRFSAVVLAYAILFFIFYKWYNIPDYFWYKAPIVFLILLFALIAIFSVISRVKSSFLDSIFSVVIILIFLFKFSLFTLLEPTFEPVRTKHSLITENEDYKNIGLWLAKNTKSNASIAMVEIGVVGYFSDRKIIDVLGLVNEHNAEFIGNKDLFSWLIFYQPDYILVHEPEYSWEMSIGPLREKGYYTFEKRFVNKFSKKTYELYRISESDLSKIKDLGKERAVYEANR